MTKRPVKFRNLPPELHPGSWRRFEPANPFAEAIASCQHCGFASPYSTYNVSPCGHILCGDCVCIKSPIGPYAVDLDIYERGGNLGVCGLCKETGRVIDLSMHYESLLVQALFRCECGFQSNLRGLRNHCNAEREECTAGQTSLRAFPKTKRSVRRWSMPATKGIELLPQSGVGRNRRPRRPCGEASFYDDEKSDVDPEPSTRKTSDEFCHREFSSLERYETRIPPIMEQLEERIQARHTEVPRKLFHPGLRSRDSLDNSLDDSALENSPFAKSQYNSKRRRTEPALKIFSDADSCEPPIPAPFTGQIYDSIVKRQAAEAQIAALGKMQQTRRRLFTDPARQSELGTVVSSGANKIAWFKFQVDPIMHKLKCPTHGSIELQTTQGEIDGYRFFMTCKVLDDGHIVIYLGAAKSRADAAFPMRKELTVALLDQRERSFSHFTFRTVDVFQRPVNHPEWMICRICPMHEVPKIASRDESGPCMVIRLSMR